MILVAGVAELYQGDLDLGRVAVARLQEAGLGDDVRVEELSYGAAIRTSASGRSSCSRCVTATAP